MPDFMLVGSPGVVAKQSILAHWVCQPMVLLSVSYARPFRLF